jgi:hypothetical protein
MKPEIGKIKTGIQHALKVSATMQKPIFIVSSQLQHSSRMVHVLSTGRHDADNLTTNNGMGVISHPVWLRGYTSIKTSIS